MLGEYNLGKSISFLQRYGDGLAPRQRKRIPGFRQLVRPLFPILLNGSLLLPTSSLAVNGNGCKESDHKESRSPSGFVALWDLPRVSKLLGVVYTFIYMLFEL